MLKSLVLVAWLAGIASAGRVYDVKAVRTDLGDDPMYPSCGAQGRMLKDKHVLRIDDDGNVTVNGFMWRVLSDEPDLSIDFHATHGQKTSLKMDLYVNQNGLSGWYILDGVLVDPDDPKNRRHCQDVVRLNGTRR